MEIYSKKMLEEKISALSEEIRSYPTPIARCDEQLSGLIEERARLLQQLSEFQEKSDGDFNAA
jgi:chorismate mutase